MRDSEQAVQRVLEGLREVEAPAGMESRMMLALERRTAEPKQTRWHRAWQPLLLPSLARRSLAGSVAFAVVACVIVWMPKFHREAPLQVVSHGAELPASATVASSPALPQLKVNERPRRVKEVRFSAVSFSDALALAEMRAPSQPAPPLPLTDQEKLLLRIARRHDPEQMAMLNPEMRSKQELQAKVEFQEFFEPTRPAEEKLHTNSTDRKGDTQ